MQTRAELHAQDFCITVREQDEVPDFACLGPNERRAAVERLRNEILATCPAEKRDRKLGIGERDTNRRGAQAAGLRVHHTGVQ
jgi:hypothetical protein